MDGGRQADPPEQAVSNKTKFFINPTGRFVVGGRWATPA
jgi:S-adenosylmethionine synthetase